MTMKNKGREKKYEGDYKTTMLLDSMMRGIMLYEAEVWDWDKQDWTEIRSCT